MTECLSVIDLFGAKTNVDSIGDIHSLGIPVPFCPTPSVLPCKILDKSWSRGIGILIDRLMTD